MVSMPSLPFFRAWLTPISRLGRSGGSGFYLQQVRGQTNVTKFSWVFNVDLRLQGWLAPRLGDQVRYTTCVRLLPLYVLSDLHSF